MAIHGFGIIVLFVAMISLLHPGVAVVYATNLKAGDQASYALTGTYGFYASLPSTEMNVLGVSGTNVTAGFTQFFPDGVLTSNVYWVDVDSGTIRNSTSTILFAVAPGLQIGDPIYRNWNIKITEQQTISCGGAVRQIEVTEFYPFYGQNNQYTVRIGWDQQTGLMCRYVSSNTNGTRMLSMGMSSTTIWGPTPTADPYGVLADISAALGLPLVVLVVYVYYRKKRRR